MCNAAGIEPVVTLAYDLNSVQDWGDLVDFTWGGADTVWGAKRIALGHPAPYNITVWELGNEQENPDFVAQVAEMEARAAKLGMPNTLTYLYPTNHGVSPSTAAQLVAAGIDPARVAPDIHIGAGGAIPVAEADFAANPSFAQSAVNMETNAKTHQLGRALDEAADLNEWCV